MGGHSNNHSSYLYNSGNFSRIMYGSFSGCSNNDNLTDYTTTSTTSAIMSTSTADNIWAKWVVHYTKWWQWWCLTERITSTRPRIYLQTGTLTELLQWIPLLNKTNKIIQVLRNIMVQGGLNDTTYKTLSHKCSTPKIQ